MKVRKNPKNVSRALCPKCGQRFDPRFHPGWRIAAGATGLVVGGLITENFFGGLLIGGLAYAAARAMDRHQALRCPECGTRATMERDSVPERPIAAEEASVAAA